MSNTQCAHVCTSSQQQASCAGQATRCRIIHFTSAGREFLPPETGDRRFTIFEYVAPSDVPPPGALNLDEVLLPEVWQPQALGGLGPYSNSMWLGSAHSDVFLNRHRAAYELDHYPERIGKWSATFCRKDEEGMKWYRNSVCVVDNFGWLVEVPTC